VNVFVNPGFFNPDYYLSIIFCDISARSRSHDLEQVISLSV